MRYSLAFAGIAAAALSLSACVDEIHGRDGVAWDGPYAYDGWYDGYYGNVYDGYWGDDDYFYYRHGDNDHRYHRGDRGHFARGDSAPRGNYQHLQGSINQHRNGVRMPHFSGTGSGMDRGERNHVRH